jgi:hypothetical protein
VRHLGGQVEGDRDVVVGGLLREPDGVVQEDLVRPGLDDQGRQARQVGEYRADETEGGVLPGRVVGDPGWSSSRLSRGSTPFLVSIVAPARVRSAYGDMR